MRLSNERIKRLQVLLKEQHGLDSTDEEAQETGLAILRFAVAKAQRQHQLAKNKGNENGQVPRNNRVTA
jgi:hypothetical protein